MRKADYAKLAGVINAERTRIASIEWFENESDRTTALESIRRIADTFARAASVDRAAFLKACGID